MVDYTFDPVYKVPTSKTIYNTPVTLNWKSKYLGLVAGISVVGQSAFVCAYNDLGLKKELGYWSSGSSTRSILYDGLLRPNTISTGVGDKFSSESIALNSQDRHTAATLDGVPVSYGFTPTNGPERSDTVTASAALLAANGAPRRIGVTQPANGAFVYNGRRNLTQDERYIYTWDDFDRIVKVEDKLAANPASEGVPAYVEYRYDAAGRRIGRLYSTNPNGLWPSERVVYDGAQLIEERNWTSGALVRRYFYEPDGKPTAVHEDTDGDATIDSTETVHILVTDDRGSVIGVLTNINGNATLVEKLHYNSTGLTKTYQADNATPWTDATAAPLARPKHVRLGFTGMYCEPFTGKYHTHYREYDPLHNWWLNPDPIAEDGGINLIAFCRGDAVNYSDPFGLWSSNPEIAAVQKTLAAQLTGWSGDIAPPNITKYNAAAPGVGKVTVYISAIQDYAEYMARLDALEDELVAFIAGEHKESGDPLKQRAAVELLRETLKTKDAKGNEGYLTSAQGSFLAMLDAYDVAKKDVSAQVMQDVVSQVPGFGLVEGAGQFCIGNNKEGAIAVGVTLTPAVAQRIMKWARRMWFLRTLKTHGLGDLTSKEVRKIQNVVEKSGTPLDVVGSTATGRRRPASDIDYLISPVPEERFSLGTLEKDLPGLDKHGPLPGYHNPKKGPAIRFEPNSQPRLIPGKN